MNERSKYFFIISLAKLFNLLGSKHKNYDTNNHDPDNHDDVIAYLEPDTLECKVKWAVGSVTMKKASGGDEFQLNNFKS